MQRSVILFPKKHEELFIFLCYFMEWLSPNNLFYHYLTENTDFVIRCPQNRMFTNKGLSVRPLEVTEQVAVEDIGGLNEDLLLLYFENEVGNVENVTLNEVEECAVITFTDHKGSAVSVDVEYFCVSIHAV